MASRQRFWILLSFFLHLQSVFFHGGNQLFADATSRSASKVDYLPGFQGPLPFQLETGYIGVDDGENVQLFYYFFKSTADPSDAPLLLWLTGGPGCSVLSAIMYEIGPLWFEDEYDGNLPRLTLNPYSWTEVANILFVDLPVGTGFSYARTASAKSSTGLQSCHQAYEFLQKWFVDHPEFISNPFYVGGDSFVGLTVPVIVQMISNGIEMGIKPNINLKGYLLGNGKTFSGEYNYKIPFAHGRGLISNELYESLKRNCKGEYKNVDKSNALCVKDIQTFNQLLDGVNTAHILESSCPLDFVESNIDLPMQRRSLDEDVRLPLSHSKLFMTKCRADKYRLAPIWTNDPRVREALHIRNGSVSSWVRCNQSLPYTNRTWDSILYHANLSAKGYRSLIYSGDHDLVVPYLSTEAWIKSLNYPIVDDWRQWRVQNQVAGYTRTYANNMTFATVKGGGHTAPEYCPIECAGMFKRWILYQPL